MIPQCILPLILILQIGSDDFRIREAAVNRLGPKPPNMAVLKFAKIRANKDPEVKHQLYKWLSIPIRSLTDELYFVGTWNWKMFSNTPQRLLLAMNNTYRLGATTGQWRIHRTNTRKYLILDSTVAGHLVEWWLITNENKESFRVYLVGSSNCSAEAVRLK